jgi:threonine 3-dehydrogenase
MLGKSMQAIMKLERKLGAELRQVAIPEISTREVLVRVLVASICGTDLDIFQWDPWSARRIHPPLVFGHEFCGIVEKTGAEVTSVAEGDLVTAEMHLACGQCLLCQTGQRHICQLGKIVGVDQDGCFAEYVKIPESNIWRFDPAIPLNHAAMFDPLGNAVHSVLAGDISGLSLAVTGCGPIGLFAISVARACGASPFFATEVHPFRRNLALQMGATEVINPVECDPVSFVQEKTAGLGVDVVLEMSGDEHAIRQGFQMLRRDGRISLMGIPATPFALDLASEVIFKGIVIQGINGRRIFDTWYKVQALLKSGALNISPMISVNIPISNFEAGMELMLSGKAAKVLMYPTGELEGRRV